MKIGVCAHKNLHTNVPSNIFLMAEKRKQYKCPSIGEWINKMCYIYTVAHYLSIKKMKYWYMIKIGYTLKTLC